MSYKDLYQEILKTQQDIAVTYQRLVAVENELKRNIKDNKTNPEDLYEKLNSLQQKVEIIIKQILVESDKEKIDEEKENSGVTLENDNAFVNDAASVIELE